MRTSIVPVLIAAALVSGVTPALAVPRDLQCYKITNENLKGLKAVVDLSTPSTGVSPGCKLTKPKLYCVPTETSVQPGTLLDGKRPQTAVPFLGPPAQGAQLCYGVKCKKPFGGATARSVTDLLGRHQLGKLQTSMLCKPVVPTSLRLQSLDVEVGGSQDIAYCHYFRLPTSDALTVKRWRALLPAFVRKVVVILTSRDLGVPGTQTGVNCGVFPDANSTDTIEWALAADEAETVFDFPTDDGTGKPVGLVLQPGQSGYLYIRYKNPSPDPVMAHVEVDADLYDAGIDVTRADSFVTYNGAINVLPGNFKSEVFTCPVPQGAKFFSLSTYTHDHATQTQISDGIGGPGVFQTTSVAHPGSARFDVPPFLTLNQLTYRCDYTNPTNLALKTGKSIALDELCMGITYFFPSAGPRLCFNNVLF